LSSYFISNIWVKNKNIIIAPLNHTNFGNRSLIFKGILLLHKYNINVFSFVNLNDFKNDVFSVLSDM